MAQIYKDHPSTICFGSGTTTFQSLLIPFIVLTIIPLIIIFMLTFMYIQIKQARSISTSRLQMMLFWSLVAQMVAVYLTMLFPGLVLLAVPLFGFRNNPKISVICFLFFSTHTIIDCVMIIYFIRPYRVYLENVIFKACCYHNELVTPVTSHYFPSRSNFVKH